MGEIFAGRYELVDVLGAGGAGVVWRAWDHRTGCYVAGKVMRQVDAASLLRFVREQAVRIEHRHVLTPLGWAGEDERVLLAMPVVRGGSAATLVGDHGPLPATWVATLLDQLLAALEVIHDQGLVHRDVKPANLLLDATGSGLPRARLADFGIAAAVDQPRLTHASHSVGTLGYAAPESLEPGWDPDPRADLYGAGLTAAELLTAQRPGRHEGSGAGDAAGGVGEADGGAARTAGGPDADVEAALVGAGVPVELSKLVHALVSPDPQDRPATAAAARRDLATTGLVARSAGELGAHPVEVFDQLPELPEGWDETGPVPTGPQRTSPERRARRGAAPERDSRSTLATTTSGQGPVSARAGARARAGLLLLALGLLMILAAVLLPG
ncbi:serine/threonine-protein kinase [Ornithinimicrobium cerasi]|uniref:non-specific serine/threonine protein kinase n=1 Tax=Ornithinimicrobium cerasi TaxID=2248773 RepID=A0A285VDD6_9MICO|nr:serine/threonine-protein kinase [Ornithinimicrobium cerasi]SOC52162.1 serine/threonine protein kinase [Ornithinimicrobium cerasi]